MRQARQLGGGHRVVIKIGGSSVDSPEKTKAFAVEVAGLVESGFEPLLVHGGGPEITEEMKRQGLHARKVAGLRVTDERTLKIAVEVLSSINGRIVRALEAEGVQAVGMMGAEAGTIKCRKMPPASAVGEDGTAVEVDLGFVGEVSSVEPSRLNKLVSNGKVPVLFPICALPGGHLANVNADTSAAHVAASFKAEQLLLVTDVPGLMREIGKLDSVIHLLHVSEIDGLIREGILGQGMIPKVEACRYAIDHGVEVAHMIEAKSSGAIADQLMGVKLAGTRVVPG
ncbi:MAG TPA: acetylglutamate kinase [Methanomassiliicoccales archaeon]|nr:acetylglutamate kinase [Methanomassiliicoccales archaeon]